MSDTLPHNSELHRRLNMSEDEQNALGDLQDTQAPGMTELERAAAAKLARERHASHQFHLRLRRLATVGLDDGNGNCKRCCKPFEYDDEGRPMHEEPIDACPIAPPPSVIPPRLALVKNETTDIITRPRRVLPFGEREDD